MIAGISFFILLIAYFLFLYPFLGMAGIWWVFGYTFLYAVFTECVVLYCWIIYNIIVNANSKRLLISVSILLWIFIGPPLCNISYVEGLEEASEQKTYLILYDREAEEATGEEQCYAVAYVDDLYYAFSCRREGEGRLVIETARPRNFERTHPLCERVTFGEVAVME